MLDNLVENNNQFPLISSSLGIFDVDENLRNSHLLSMVEYMYNPGKLEAEVRALGQKLICRALDA